MRAAFITMLMVSALSGCKQETVTAEPTATVERAEPTLQPVTTFHTTGTAFDGDDLEVHVRMNGFDTPERGKFCRNPNPTEALPERVNVWNEAQDALDRIIVERRDSRIARYRRVDCVLVGHDEQGERMVARCSVEGRDIGEQMVEQGWARDWPEYSARRYADEEDEARRLRRGIWGLDCGDEDVWSGRDYTAP